MSQGPIEHVLIVDDDPALNELMATAITRPGQFIDRVHSIDEAFRALANKAYDLILLDQLLGDGEGIDVLRWLRQQSGEHGPAVVMISAKDDPAFLETCFYLGVDDYLIKPVHLPLLVLKTRNLLENNRLKQEVAAKQSSLKQLLSQIDTEQQMARFIYEHLHQRYNDEVDGLISYIQPHSLFSGDMVMTCIAPNGHCFGLMADATGHGLAAALTMMPVLTVLHSMVKKGFSLGVIAREVNRKVNEESPDDRFVAAIMFEMNPHRRTLDVWNAGMPPALWIDPDAGIVHRFHSQHLPMGILDDDAFEGAVETFSMPEDGHFFTYSDGLVEQRNPDGEPMAMAQLERTVERFPLSRFIDDCLDLLADHAGARSLEDDVSLMIWQPQRAINQLVRTPQQSQFEPGQAHWQYTLSGEALSAEPIMEAANTVLQRWLVSLEIQRRAYTVLAELVNNALDHGCLGLSSALKVEDFEEYLKQRQVALNTLDDTDRVRVGLSLSGTELHIEVEDSGDGYLDSQSGLDDWRALSGRGIALVEALSSSFVVHQPGNAARATLSLIGQDAYG